jgi:carotenoid 1,2-hydratase
LTIIAFVGSAFSPYYAHAFSKYGDAVEAQNHCAINIALYGPSNRRWTMTERGLGSVERGTDFLQIGPSGLKWNGSCLEIDLNEVGMPIPMRVRGRVRVYPEALCTYSNALDDKRKHRWGPIAPCARIEVDLPKPGLSWRGNAYLDSNEGDEPITGPFKTWDWSRARMADGSTSVIYDVTQTNGARTLLAERFNPDGTWSSFEASPLREKLPSTGWRIDRGTRTSADGIPGAETRVLDTLEDTPFYARSLLRTHMLGEQVTAVQETLEPQRLNRLPVRLMLPWRMPRRA